MVDKVPDDITHNPRFGLFRGPAERELGFLLVPTFSMLAFVSAVEPLRVANRLSGRPLYGWHVISVTGDHVTANNGMRQQAEVTIADAPGYATVVVCGAQISAQQILPTGSLRCSPMWAVIT